MRSTINLPGYSVLQAGDRVKISGELYVVHSVRNMAMGTAAETEIEVEGPMIGRLSVMVEELEPVEEWTDTHVVGEIPESGPDNLTRDKAPWKFE